MVDTVIITVEMMMNLEDQAAVILMEYLTINLYRSYNYKL